MPKTSDEEKIQQVLKFLMSFRKSDIARLMSLRGFTDVERQKGFVKVDKAAGRHLAIDDVSKGLSGPDKSLVTAIDNFENTWYDVVDATLRYDFPKVHAKVLKNLKKSSGVMVVLTVKTLLARIAGLEKSNDKDEKAAFALLTQRGLDEKQQSYAQGLVEQAYSETEEPSDEPRGPTEQELNELRAAVDDMWAWYLGWAMIGRTVVKDKRLRIMMGISSRSSHDEDEGDEGGGTGAGGTTDSGTPAK